MRVSEGVADEYDRGRRRESVGFWAKETARLANLHGGSLVLDLGCGTGIYTLAVGLGASAFTCGIDPAVAMLAQARAKSRVTPWIVAVGEEIPIRPGVFDCIFSSQVWHHLADGRRTAKECFRVLKPGGALVIRTISHEQLRRRVVFRYFPEGLAHTLEAYPSEDDFNRYFEDAGFHSTEHLSYTLERYQPASELVEIAMKGLWSMFRNITSEGLQRGIARLRQHDRENQSWK